MAIYIRRRKFLATLLGGAGRPGYACARATRSLAAGGRHSAHRGWQDYRGHRRLRRNLGSGWPSRQGRCRRDEVTVAHLPLLASARECSLARSDSQYGRCGLPSSRAAQVLSERRQSRLRLRVIFGVADEHSDPFYLCRLLRARRERPRGCRSADELDELASSHGGLGRGNNTLPHGCTNAALCINSKIWLPMADMGHSRQRRTGPAGGLCPQYAQYRP